MCVGLSVPLRKTRYYITSRFLNRTPNNNYNTTRLSASVYACVSNGQRATPTLRRYRPQRTYKSEARIVSYTSSRNISSQQWVRLNILSDMQVFLGLAAVLLLIASCAARDIPTHAGRTCTYCIYYLRILFLRGQWLIPCFLIFCAEVIEDYETVFPKVTLNGRTARSVSLQL